jgi:transposase
MQQFPTVAKLGSWAGLGPANHESAKCSHEPGKRLAEAHAHTERLAATERKGSRLQARYPALRVRCGDKHATAGGGSEKTKRFS